MPSNPKQKFRVVTCDDDIFITKIVVMAPSKLGIDVASRTDGEQAWQLIEEECPDLLISDCEMPHLSGLELTRRLRREERYQHLPIILLTAKAFQLSEDQLRRDLSVNAVLKKPFSPRQLRELVSRTLKEVSIEAS